MDCLPTRRIGKINAGVYVTFGVLILESLCRAVGHRSFAEQFINLTEFALPQCSNNLKGVVLTSPAPMHAPHTRHINLFFFFAASFVGAFSW